MDLSEPQTDQQWQRDREYGRGMSLVSGCQHRSVHTRRCIGKSMPTVCQTLEGGHILLFSSASQARISCAVGLWFAECHVHLVQRPNTVKIKAQDETGAKVSLSLTDWQARIFQHEYDHLQVGSLMFS